MQQKVVTSEIFKGKKAGYADSLSQPFASSRLGKCAVCLSVCLSDKSREEHRPSREQVFSTGAGDTPAVLVPSPDESDINPKVLQLLGSEKIQVHPPCVRPPPRPFLCLRPGRVFPVSV